MKNLLITTGIFSPDIGGPASFGRALAQYLGPKKKVTVLTYSSVWRFKEDRQWPFRTIRIWKKWPWFWRHTLYALRLLREAPRHEQILVLNVLNGGLPALIVKKFFGKKLTVRVVGDRVWERAVNHHQTFLLIDDWQKSKPKGWLGMMTRMQTMVCRRADRVIVPSQYLARLVHGWGVPEEKIKVIYNGVDFAPSSLSKEEARKQLGIPGNIIVSIGRLVPWKGFRLLVKIVPQLLRINQFFRLVIIGNGPEEKILRMMIKNMGLEKKVYLTGKKSPQEVAVYLTAAEIFLLNTGYEGFSHQILEAMKAGVPVVTTAAGGNREVVRQGENGFMVKYNDEFNLVEAVKTVWQTPELQQRFKEEGQKTVEHFSVEKMLAEVERTLLSQ